MASLEGKDKWKKISNVRLVDTVSNEKLDLRQVLRSKYLDCIVCFLFNLNLVFLPSVAFKQVDIIPEVHLLHVPV